MRFFRLASVAALAGALLGPALAAAKPWQGIHPGQSTAADVTNRFGEPTTRARRGNRTVLAYLNDQAPAGTNQAQFALGDDGTVQEITVFVATELDRESIEGTYGKAPEKTFTDEFLPVWLYRAAGVTVYFAKEGRVEAITFSAGTKGRPSDGAPAAPPSAKAP